LARGAREGVKEEGSNLSLQIFLKFENLSKNNKKEF
jgi:hypothetical protein